MSDVRDYRVNGVRLVCESAGPDDGPPLLLLHALGENRGSWSAAAAALAADGRRTIALDLRGHGDSDHWRTGDPAGRARGLRCQAAGGLPAQHPVRLLTASGGCAVFTPVQIRSRTVTASARR